MYATASGAEGVLVSPVDFGVIGVGVGEGARDGSGDEGHAVEDGPSLSGDEGHSSRVSCVSPPSQHHTI